MARVVKLRRDDKYRPIGTPLWGRKEKVGEFMAYKITDKCIACGACAANCPVSCISDKGSKYEIDPSMCISCGTCAQVCPVDAPEEE